MVIALAACASTERSGEPLEERQVGLSALAIRPDEPGAASMPPAYGATDRIESFDSEGGRFRVHFTRAGDHAVPSDDADDDGVPDYVQAVAAEYESVMAFFLDDLGFAAPPSDDGAAGEGGGDGRFDVYLLDFPNSADGAFREEGCSGDARPRCSGYMVQENDFNDRGYPSLGDAVSILASHELFHAVQSGYHGAAGAVVREGTAVWASEAYAPDLGDFEGFVSGYLDRPERSLGQAPTGPFDAFSYGSGLFFQFLSERHHADLILHLWEALRDDGETWTAALDGVLERDEGSSLGEAFAAFAEWNLYTDTRADSGRAYAEGDRYPGVREREIELPYMDPVVRVFPLAARYYTARTTTSAAIALGLSAPDGGLDGLHAMLVREADGALVEVVRSEGEVTTPVLLSGLAAGDRLHAVIVNTRLEGESARPALCLGELPEVEVCLASGGMDGPARAGSATDGGLSLDAGTEAASGASGCTVVSGADAHPTLGWLAVLSLSLCRRMRRK